VVWIVLGSLSLLFGLLYALNPEPIQKPMLTNPDGEPILVDRLPSGSSSLEAHFSLPVELSGVKLPEGLDSDGNASFQLYWRVTGTVPRGIGIVSFIELPDGRRFPVQRPVLGGTFFFKNAPQNTLLRDDFSLHLGGSPPLLKFL
jgi:hypothetical protein